MLTIPEYLSRTAARYPRKEALRFKEASLTYAELERAASRLAGVLAAKGVRPGDRVGICMNKQIASVVSVFGIMKAGAAYVPLDPSAPVDRLRYIAADCGMKVCLVSEEKLATAEGLGDVRLLVVNRGDLTTLPTAEPEFSPDPSALAFILYTSGSTGRPKGVRIPHSALDHFLEWSEKIVQLGPEDRVTSHAPLHFDLSTFDLYASVKAGAGIVLVPEDLSYFPVMLAELLAREAITVTYMVPSILTMMVTHGKLETFDWRNLRAVLFAGEVFPLKHLRELVNRIPNARYLNLYGPTETNVCSYHEVTARDLADPDLKTLPIGIPCGNTELLVLDEGGKPITEPGIEGELSVRGSCVAQGYWNATPKDAARFQGGTYRTGDIVAYQAGGKSLLFFGRRDHMVKVRGFRIELGEVESVILQHPQVKMGVVTLRSDETAGNTLHGFVEPVADGSLDAGELRRHCARFLPKYMIPETFTLLDTLPLTSSGKINRMQLQEQLYSQGARS